MGKHATPIDLGDDVRVESSLVEGYTRVYEWVSVGYSDAYGIVVVKKEGGSRRSFSFLHWFV